MIPAHVGAHNPDGVRRHGRFDAFRSPARTPLRPQFLARRGTVWLALRLQVLRTPAHLELTQPPGNINVDLVTRIAAVIERIAFVMTKSGASSSAWFAGQPRSTRCLSATNNLSARRNSRLPGGYFRRRSPMTGRAATDMRQPPRALSCRWILPRR